MRMDVYIMFHENWKFIAELDTGSETGAHQLAVWCAEKTQDGIFREPGYLRDFYFEEANERHIRSFCHKFASDETYRQAVLAQQTPWAQRNALFTRNLLSVLGEDTLLSNNGDYEQRAHSFFRWFDIHTQEILALPEYQWLLQIDNTFQPNSHEIDPGIRQAIELFNKIPGVTTRFSCQGVSGKVRFQQHSLLAVTPHEEYAYISFSSLSTLAHDTIITLIPAYNSITNARIPCNFAFNLHLRSNGDNLRFREEIVELALAVLARVDESWQHAATDKNYSWRNIAYPEHLTHTNAPGGILPSRLTWLCQPAQLDRTLLLLFHLNHWANSLDQLFYADRQGLYRVKMAIIQQAYITGALPCIAYIDGTSNFAHEYNIDLATELAAELFIERLENLFSNQPFAQENELDKAALQLFQHIKGYDATSPSDIASLDMVHVITCIGEYFQALIDEACNSRQPIPTAKIAALFIDPMDLLNIIPIHNRTWLSWDTLDDGNLRKLDPESSSFCVFRYESITSQYAFNLPLRVAELFLPPQFVSALKKQPMYYREYGLFYGRTITQAESQAFPIEHILQELLVDVSSLCPHKLAKKKEA